MPTSLLPSTSYSSSSPNNLAAATLIWLPRELFSSSSSSSSVSFLSWCRRMETGISASLKTRARRRNFPICASQEVVSTEDALDRAQAALQQRITESPHLRSLVADKLLEILGTLDQGHNGSSSVANVNGKALSTNGNGKALSTNGNGKAPSTMDTVHRTTNGTLLTQDVTTLPAAERIRRGFLNFKSEKLLKQPALFEKLAVAQYPKYLVIACCDSRVCPTAILGFEPGEAFVVRNVANFVPRWDKVTCPGTSAALEFAVLQLKVENIMVIGHSRCGGIRALMSQEDNGNPWSEFIESWIEQGKQARSLAKAAASKDDLDQQCSHCEKKSLELSLSNLLTFPWIKDAVTTGKLALHGGYYDFVEGSFEHWILTDSETKIMKY